MLQQSAHCPVSIDSNYIIINYVTVSIDSNFFYELREFFLTTFVLFFAHAIVVRILQVCS
jgi:hypothetical protein